MKKIYLSGQITGLAFDDVVSRFAAAESRLAAPDVLVMNPLNNGLTRHHSWIEHMCKDLSVLHSCDAVYMLDGWACSLGSCIELDFAKREGKEIIYQNACEENEVVSKVGAAVRMSTGYSIADISTDARMQPLCFARMLYSHNCKELGLPLVKIASSLNRNHSTILHNIRQYDIEVELNRDFREKALSVKRILESSIRPQKREF